MALIFSVKKLNSKATNMEDLHFATSQAAYTFHQVLEKE